MSHYSEQEELNSEYIRKVMENNKTELKTFTPMFQHCNDAYTGYIGSVKHPIHYNRHASGIECIDIVKHMNFCLGSAVKYIWRADLKGNGVEDLQKAIENIQFEIDRRQNHANVEE